MTLWKSSRILKIFYILQKKIQMPRSWYRCWNNHEILFREKLDSRSENPWLSPSEQGFLRKSNLEKLPSLPVQNWLLLDWGRYAERVEDARCRNPRIAVRTNEYVQTRNGRFIFMGAEFAICIESVTFVSLVSTAYHSLVFGNNRLNNSVQKFRIIVVRLVRDTELTYYM